MQVARNILRYLILILLAAYFLVAGGLLVVKFWVLPDIDRWRPQIEQALSEAIGAPVHLGSLKASWTGLRPDFELTALSITDIKDDQALIIPRIEAVLSWRSLTALAPRFRYIGVDGLALAVERTKDGVVHVAGFEIDQEQAVSADRPDESSKAWYENPAARWLLAQGQINLTNSIVIWLDQTRDAPPLRFENIAVGIRNTLLSHELEGGFDLSSSAGQRVEFALESGRIDSVFEQMVADKVDGQLFVSVSAFEPQALKPWFDLTETSGRYAARAWVGLRDGRLSDLTLDLAAMSASVGSSSPETTSWLARSLKLRLTGPLGMILPDDQFAHLVSPAGATAPFSVQFKADEMTVDPPADVIAPLQMEHLELAAQMSRAADGEISLKVDKMLAATADGVVAASGSWRKPVDSAAGLIDINGSLSRFDLSRLHHYMPATVGQDVIGWMKEAFKSGLVPQASFVVRGQVDEFPFEKPGSSGVFTLDGTFQDWSIDYAPTEDPKGLAWPPLVDLKGKLNLNRDRLSVQSSAGGLAVTEQTRIAVSRIDASMTDLFGSPKLSLRARTAAPAQGYLAALTKTALADTVPSAVTEIKGTGDWTMELDLTMALDNIENLDFQTSLDLNGGSLLYADFPALDKVGGKAVFSRSGFESRGLKASLLGGTVTIDGGFGPGQQPLAVKGSLAMQAVANQFQLPSLNRWMKGQIPFEVGLQQDEKTGTFKISLDSSLRGLQLDFPAPMVKSSAGELPTRLNWEIDPSGASLGKGEILLGNLLQLSAVGRSGNGRGSSLASVALGVGTKATSVSDGLTVNVNTKTLDAKAWQEVSDQVMRDLQKRPPSARPFMPELATAQLASDRLIWGDMSFDAAKLMLRIPRQGQYLLEFSSRQTAGTVSWFTKDGEVVGRMQANLSRLEFDQNAQSDPKANPSGSEAARVASDLPDDLTLSTIPPIDLTINELVLHGMNLGKLHLLGRNSDNNKRWNIDRLELVNPDAQLSATGQWRFEKNSPGISADLTLNISDLGALLARMGQPDKVRRGSGTIKAQIDWVNFPWQLGYEGMSGKAQVDLTEGIFDHVNSGAARVLELLSLQSLNRLLNLNINRNETFESGFPWNNVRGNLEINRGDISTKDLAINSPVATISFKGGTSLLTESFSLSADVRPNLDLSGTAMATGFLLNPVVGLSALIGQYILKNPIENALTLQYEVTGPWAEPQLREIGAKKEPSAPSAKPAGDTKPISQSVSQPGTNPVSATGSTAQQAQNDVAPEEPPVPYIGN